VFLFHFEYLQAKNIKISKMLLPSYLCFLWTLFYFVSSKYMW